MAENNQLAEQATTENDSLLEGIDYSCSLSQARFEELCMDYSVIPGTSWRVPAKQRYRAEKRAWLGASGRLDLNPEVHP